MQTVYEYRAHVVTLVFHERAPATWAWRYQIGSAQPVDMGDRPYRDLDTMEYEARYEANAAVDQKILAAEIRREGKVEPLKRLMERARAGLMVAERQLREGAISQWQFDTIQSDAQAKEKAFRDALREQPQADRAKGGPKDTWR